MWTVMQWAAGAIARLLGECGGWGEGGGNTSVIIHKFVCVEVLWPSQPNAIMSRAVSFT